MGSGQPLLTSNYHVSIHVLLAQAAGAFIVDWSGENKWWFPPPVLIPRVLKHVMKCRTLVVPYWESAPYCHCYALMEADLHVFKRFLAFDCGVRAIPL